MADPFFRVHRSQLFPAITAVFEAVDTKATIPILANILLRPAGDRLFVRGTDLNIEIEAECELLEKGDGMAITLDGAKLRDVVRNLPESAEIEFLPGAFDGQVRLRAGRSSFSIFSLPERDFPSIAQHVKGEPFAIDVKSVAQAFGKVLYAAENASSDRVYLTGICLHPYEDGEKIAIAATNGRCVAVVRIPAKTRADFRSIILPVKAATAIRKYMGEGKSEATVRISETLLQIECDSIRIITSLIDGTYPDYMRVVPKENEKVMRATIDTLSNATHRVCLVSGDTAKEALVLTMEGSALRLDLSSRDGETANDEVSVEYGGDEFTIGFNGTLFEKTLEAIATTDVDIFFGDPISPAIFKPTAALDEFYILMPMRVNAS
ncbi:DNA polymerase III subunit beta [Rhizobium mongolense]|uniref:Beta sliding clamp n=1 Tax=Rhizobium mongolense TaxID=57676 RepID=A0A7W6WG19_9HYPH|nr:DNA polymerase III subunit beta [Rhizobium mongolense]MBB4277057.1 DNA polymerase-3 subunit beta [Rhizobium mongolense]